MKVYNDIKMHDIKKLQLRGSIFVYNSTIKTGLLYTFSSYFCEMISNYRKKKEKKKQEMFPALNLKTPEWIRPGRSQ